jgi:hypothetical protein
MNRLKPARRARKAAEVTQNCDHLTSVGISSAPTDQSALNSPVRVTIMANSPQRYAPSPHERVQAIPHHSMDPVLRVRSGA